MRRYALTKERSWQRMKAPEMPRWPRLFPI
jgi:hypothetical protein